jgi:hypothetical protein
MGDVSTGKKLRHSASDPAEAVAAACIPRACSLHVTLPHSSYLRGAGRSPRARHPARTPHAKSLLSSRMQTPPPGSWPQAGGYTGVPLVCTGENQQTGPCGAALVRWGGEPTRRCGKEKKEAASRTKSATSKVCVRSKPRCELLCVLERQMCRTGLATLF